MPLNTVALLKAAEVVAESKEMKVTVTKSLLGAGITSITTFIGGLIAGPLGLLVGATSGGIISYKCTNNQFKPVADIIRNDLTPAQQRRLASLLEESVREFDITDVVQLLAAIQSQEALFMVVFTTVKGFIENDCKLPLAPC